MDYKPSKYNIAIEEAYRDTNCNINICATAGSGKTTCLLRLLNQTPPYKKVIFLAFNKSIADELKQRVPNHVEVNTLHSLGYRILRQNYKRVFKVNQNKTFIIARKKLNLTNFKSERDKNAYLYKISDLVDIYRLYLCQNAEDLANSLLHYSDPIEPNDIKNTLLIVSELEKYNSRNHQEFMIDFTDMLYLTKENIDISKYPKYDVVMIDECFPYDQYVSTSCGKLKIGSIYKKYSSGEDIYVKSYNEKLDTFEFKRVSNVWKKGEKDLLKIVAGGKRNIVCTYNHPILTNRGWINAIDINCGDYILSSSKHQPYHSFLNSDQICLFEASSIGDGSLDKLSNGVYRCRFIHGENQKEYCEWKASIFNIKYLNKIEENGFSKKDAYAFQTKGFCIKNYIEDKYKLIDKLTYKHLAILYMDDGSYSDKTRSMLYTFAYSKKLCYKLRDKIFELGIKGSIYESKSSSSNKPYWFISFSKIETDKLFYKICEYMHPSMKYKIDEKYHNDIGRYSWNTSETNTGGMCVSSKILNYKKDVVYDIEVEDNHNFIICSSVRSKRDSVNINEGFIVHNCQDVSGLQRHIATNIVKKNGRIISCGDEKQLIYSFLGADINSFNIFKELPNTKSLPLSVSYRCGTKIIEEANKVFPGTESPEGKEPGIVRNGYLEEAQPGDFILCRNNQPLIEAYLKLLKQRKKAHIVGKDFGKSLLKLSQKVLYLDEDDAKFYFESQLKEKAEELKQRGIKSPHNHQAYGNLKERIDIINYLKYEFKTFLGVNEAIEEMFSDKNSSDAIILSTIHKAKGSESDRVFALMPDLIPSKYAKTNTELNAERCLMFVLITRAKKELIYLNSI